MTRAIQGKFSDGHVELVNPPQDASAGDVVVVFVDESPESLQPAERDQLMAEMFDEMELGFHMGGRPYAKREDLYDRLSRQ